MPQNLPIPELELLDVRIHDHSLSFGVIAGQLFPLVSHPALSPCGFNFERQSLAQVAGRDTRARCR